MRRHILRGVTLLAGVVSIWWGGVVWLNSTVFSASEYLGNYLGALESGDYEKAAALAGWSSPSLPVTSTPLRNPSVTGVGRIDSTTWELEAEFELDSEPSSGIFTLTRSSSLLGVFHQWRFLTPPVASVTVTTDTTAPAFVGGREVANGQSVDLLVPGVYAVESGTPWVAYAPSSLSVSGPTTDAGLRLEAFATDALVGEVDRAVDRYLDDCVVQAVLQPASCPFGITIVDRVVGTPEWTISQRPRLAISADGPAGSWVVVGEAGEATLSADVQSLFDGRIEPFVESQPFVVTGTLTGLDGPTPELQID